MKFLVVDAYYQRFLEKLYRDEVLLARSYEEQRRRLVGSAFGTGDYYSRHLVALGHEAEELVGNCVPLQLRWAREERASPLGLVPSRLGATHLVAQLASRFHALAPILVEQIRRAQPDVLLLHDLELIPPAQLRGLRRHVGSIVGQIASPLPRPDFLAPYDLIVTSFPHYVERLRARGLGSEYFRLGFEASLVERVGVHERIHPVTFVGGISREHSRGTRFLEELARETEIEFFGYGASGLSEGSPIRARHRGEVWALDMYRTLAASRVTLNRHIDVAEGFANNMRLYEATGMGALLVTDAKQNLGDLFVVGKEVVAYASPEEAVRLIRHYIAHPDEAAEIARAGQARTLREHSYAARMKELVEIVERHRARGR